MSACHNHSKFSSFLNVQSLLFPSPQQLVTAAPGVWCVCWQGLYGLHSTQSLQDSQGLHSSVDQHPTQACRQLESTNDYQMVTTLPVQWCYHGVVSAAYCVYGKAHGHRPMHVEVQGSMNACKGLQCAYTMHMWARSCYVSCSPVKHAPNICNHRTISCRATR